MVSARTSNGTDESLIQALRRAGVGDVDASGLARALYSSDASLYRVLPRLVVRPRHVDEIVATLAVCREHDVPLTMRGAGTSIAGNAVGSGVVVDTSAHLDRVRGIDVEAGTAQVEPGVVQAALQRAARPYGLLFGPDPSTHNRCTVGGMIGNNACGSRALGYGRTSDNVVALDVLTGGGERLHLSDQAPTGGVLKDLQTLIGGELALLRTEFGRFGRQVSGYSLEHLLPERGFDVARALVGTEGTLALVLGATVRLVREPALRRLVVLGYPSMADSADAAPSVVRHGPTAVEGLDARIVQRLRDVPHAVLPELPRGEGWLMVELTGSSSAELESKARGVVADAQALDTHVVTDPDETAALWRIREDGAGLAARTPDGLPAHAGWEDAAVPPERLGAYLRGFEALLVEYGLVGVPYGHFGDGCVHVRIDFPFRQGQDGPDRGRSVYRRFVADAARLVAGFGGSLSGEHGDGRARSELLPLMYSPAAISLFGRVKGLFDPGDLLNPGVIVHPARVDRAIRVAQAPSLTTGLGFALRRDAGDFSAAVHRCTGVGKCRADLQATGGVMCPSWPATRDEKDTTRGRARVLQEMLAEGGPVRGWRSPEVHAALDLCLSCKGCSRDCPTGIDMATYKSEVLHRSYRRRPRPRSHYALGQLPRWADLAARAPRLANAATRSRLGGRLARWAAGVDQRRDLPTFAPHTFRQLWAARGEAQTGGSPVALWIDSFTDHFVPEVAVAAVAVLEHAGYEVRVPDGDTCCGLTWITTGQLEGAHRIVGRTVAALAPLAEAGVPIVGLEPSCTAVLRHDAHELLDDPRADAVARATTTLAELLTATPGWRPPDLAGLTVVAQPHCHHASVLGWSADERLLRKAGATVSRLGGCCGLAGNWGVERGHYEVSVRIAEQCLLPAVRDLPDDGVVLADGFSCRTQLDHLADRPGMHLAQLLARASAT